MTEPKIRERRPAARNECPACSAKDMTITVLADQVDWLRQQLAAAQTGSAPVVTAASAPRVFPEPDASGRMWVSDQEEELAEMRAAGYLDERSYLEAMAAEQVSRSVIDQKP